MPAQIKHIDAIARKKQRAVLYLEFHPRPFKEWRNSTGSLARSFCSCSPGGRSRIGTPIQAAESYASLQPRKSLDCSIDGLGCRGKVAVRYYKIPRDAMPC